MSRTGTRTSNARRGRANGNGNGRSSRPRDNEGIIPVLARTVREVEGRVRRGSTRASDHATFQAIALLAREERTRVKSDKSLGEAHVAEQLKRLDGIGTILATTAALNPAFFDLLADDAVLSSETLATKRQMQAAAGFEAEARSRDRRLRSGHRVRDRSPRGAPVRGEPQAGPPLPVPRLHRRRVAPPAHWCLGQLGAARPALPLLRGGLGRRAVLHGAAGAGQPERAGLQGADEAPGRGGRRRQGRAPHLPAGRRARARQDRPGAARGAGRRRLPDAGRGAQRGEDELGP